MFINFEYLFNLFMYLLLYLCILLPCVQVTLEEQMICGALQTLNEEAFEDVASSERPSPSGLPTGEMLAAASQLQLAPICESSEFGSPADEQRMQSLLQYNNNNNNNNGNSNNNNNNNSGAQQQHQQGQQEQQHKYLNKDYNRSASSHSLQSLNAGAVGGCMTTQLSQGNNGSTVDLISVGGGGGGYGGSYGGGSNTYYGARLTRPNSIADELLIEPMTPSTVPTVVVVPNSDSVYDDTKL